jgi:hypothetical protein
MELGLAEVLVVEGLVLVVLVGHQLQVKAMRVLALRAELAVVVVALVKLANR